MKIFPMLIKSTETIFQDPRPTITQLTHSKTLTTLVTDPDHSTLTWTTH